jgi:hypothetical protein
MSDLMAVIIWFVCNQMTTTIRCSDTNFVLVWDLGLAMTLSLHPALQANPVSAHNILACIASNVCHNRPTPAIVAILALRIGHVDMCPWWK